MENLHQKIALIEEVEELAEQAGRLAEGTKVGNKSEGDFLREVQEMQRRFRDIGHVPRDRMDDVYEKFKGAADKVYAALEPYLTKLDEERQANLEEKRKFSPNYKNY